MKRALISVALLTNAVTGVFAQDQDALARMSRVSIDCSTFIKFGPNWRALKDTTVSIKVDGKNDGALPLNKGTPVTGILTYGIYLEDILEARCLKGRGPAPTERAAVAVTPAVPPKPASNLGNPKPKHRPVSADRRSFGVASGWAGCHGCE